MPAGHMIPRAVVSLNLGVGVSNLRPQAAWVPLHVLACSNLMDENQILSEFLPKCAPV